MEGRKGAHTKVWRWSYLDAWREQKTLARSEVPGALGKQKIRLLTGSLGSFHM